MSTAHNIWMVIINHFIHFFQIAFICPIIAINENNIFTRCNSYTDLSRADNATICFVNNMNAIISLREIVTYKRTGICRAVINKNNFNIVIALSYPTLYALTKKTFNVKNWMITLNRGFFIFTTLYYLSKYCSCRLRSKLFMLRYKGKF